MSRPIKRDISASIRQRLLDLSKHENRPFGEVLQYYAMERFLFRLSKSKYADRFILKGALLLAVWRSEVSRSTMDIDLLVGASKIQKKPLRLLFGLFLNRMSLMMELSTMRAQSGQNLYLKMRCIEGFVFLL